MPAPAGLRLLIGRLFLCCALCHGGVRAADPTCSGAASAVPSRSADARGGADFAQAIASLTEPERDLAIRTELLAGNIPEFLRKARAVTRTVPAAGGGRLRLTLCVLPDYLSIGSDADFLLVPMGLATALTVASRYGFTLPTPQMVDLIYARSRFRMRPQPLAASDDMRSTAYYTTHNRMVRHQRTLAGVTPDALISGDKKDLVLSARLWSQDGRVAIYGWHRAEHAPIQPLSTVHGARYADYSHGVRLVRDVAYVNGKPRSLFDLLSDPQLSALLSGEGPLPQAASLFRNMHPPSAAR